MSEEIANNGVDTTQVTNDIVNEENGIDNQPTQQEAVNGDETVENSNDVEDCEQQDGGQPNVDEQPKQPTVEELQSKLKEYQVREEEEKMIRERLGVSDVDQQTFNYMNIDQQIVNEGKQVYLRLCNEYGIDANPSNIDASVNKLKETDPAKAYEFQKRFEDLGKEVEYKRSMVQQQNASYELNKFNNDYGQILNASPAINELVTSYVSNYMGQGNVYNELQGVLEAIMPAYQEAFNAGRQYALQDKAKKDTSGVSGGVATSNTATYSSSNSFTRDQLRNMSVDEFAKHEKQIKQAMLEGKIY